MLYTCTHTAVQGPPHVPPGCTHAAVQGDTAVQGPPVSCFMCGFTGMVLGGGNPIHFILAWEALHGSSILGRRFTDHPSILGASRAIHPCGETGTRHAQRAAFVFTTTNIRVTRPIPCCAVPTVYLTSTWSSPTGTESESEGSGLQRLMCGCVECVDSPECEFHYFP